MKSNLHNYIQTVLDQVQQSTEAYHLKVEGDMSSLQTVVSQETRGICACITEGLDRVHHDISDSSEGPCLHFATSSDQ